MICPKCGAAMKRLAALHDAEVDRCDNCHGLFVGEQALQSLQRDWFLWSKADLGRVDSGNPRVGRAFDQIANIDCPACGRPMSPVSVRDQPHIWLERCAACKGMFFDAGELTDLRYKTIVDLVRDLIKGRRPA